MKNWQHVAMTIGLASLLAPVSCTYTSHKSRQMNTIGWRTHCFGRFLVDLPPQTKITQTYKIWGDKIERLPDTPRTVARKVSLLEDKLKNERNKNKDSMLVRRIEHANGSTSLLSWYSPNSMRGMLLNSYLIAKPADTVFQNQGEVSPSKEQSAISEADKLASNIRSRVNTEIPKASGFCIDGGVIEGSEYRSESFSVDASFPGHPNAQLEIFASTGAEENRLLERVGGFLRTEVLGTAAGLKTLRKRKRDVGPIDAEEYLVAATGNGQRVYSFAWESQGKDDSLSEPNIGVNLGVLEQSVVSDREPYRPAFKSDEEALELWDAIIASIRLRPGAV